MTRRKFSREFKIEAVRLVTDRGVAVAHAARDLDVAESVICRWMRELTATSVTALFENGHMQADLAEIAALKKEVAPLSAERDILKKAAVGSTDQRNIFDLRCFLRTRDGTSWSLWLVAGAEV